MTNHDYYLVRKLEKFCKKDKLIEKYVNKISSTMKLSIDEIEHPLDSDILGCIKQIHISEQDDDFKIFYHVDKIKEIWRKLIEKSIKCLRYFDKREPFMVISTKSPVAYGSQDLCQYFERYSEFESMLYGSGKRYRDHIVHVFRVWLLGLELLLENNGEYLNEIALETHILDQTLEKGSKVIEVNELEKLSIWTMIALTHDLGYPLEKAQDILDKTRDMMKSFVSNPNLAMDLSFHGVQNNMNDFVVRFLSSKMHKQTNNYCVNQSEDNNLFVARLQPKYYFKFQKSLEKNSHGILSAIIIYKLLIYFMESDFSINEDYIFTEEDARQFYIRRSIVRSIASHTCFDVFHLSMFSFAYLLIVVDDAQEWGRKKITELYVNPKSDYTLDRISIKPRAANSRGINVYEFIIEESFIVPKDEYHELSGILKSLWRQSEKYNRIFRDGKETAKRDFIFKKHCKICYDAINTYDISFISCNERESSFTIATSDVNNDISLQEIFAPNIVSLISEDNNKKTYKVICQSFNRWA